MPLIQQLARRFNIDMAESYLPSGRPGRRNRREIDLGDVIIGLHDLLHFGIRRMSVRTKLLRATRDLVPHVERTLLTHDLVNVRLVVHANSTCQLRVLR